MKTLFIILLLFPIILNAEEKESEMHQTLHSLKVGARMVDPFVSYLNEKEYDGYVYQLLKQMFPDIKIEIIPMDSVNEAIKRTKNGEVDFTIGAFSITEERENIIDFSHAFFQSKPAIATRVKGTWIDTIIWIAQRVIIAIGIFIIMLYIVGFIINKIDGDTKIQTTNQGAWWALVTFSTVGYGDFVPDTNKGKFVASIWIVSSLFLISVFTGYVSSAMTVKRLTEQPTNLNYLSTKRLATVGETTSADLLNALNFNYRSFKNVENAILELINGRIDAIIYDKPILEYHLRDNENYQVWEIPNSVKEPYAFILPEDSEIEERVNREMLRVLPTTEWQQIHNSYFNKR